MKEVKEKIGEECPYPYCTMCGEEDNLSYLTQYACGDHYECNECGHEICFSNKPNNP